MRSEMGMAKRREKRNGDVNFCFHRKKSEEVHGERFRERRKKEKKWRGEEKRNDGLRRRERFHQNFQNLNFELMNTDDAEEVAQFFSRDCVVEEFFF